EFGRSRDERLSSWLRQLCDRQHRRCDRTVVEHLHERLQRFVGAPLMVEHVGTQGHGTALVPGPLITAECLPGRSPQPIMLPEDEGLSSLDDRVTRAARTHSVAHILQRLGLSRRSKYETDDI